MKLNDVEISREDLVRQLNEQGLDVTIKERSCMPMKGTNMMDAPGVEAIKCGSGDVLIRIATSCQRQERVYGKYRFSLMMDALHTIEVEMGWE